MSEATVPQAATDNDTTPPAPWSGSVGDAFVLRRTDGNGTHVHCAECDHHFGPATSDPKLGAVMSERSIAELSDLNAEGMVDRLVARHYFCPSCGLLFAINVQQHDDPVMLEWSLEATEAEPRP